MLLAQSPDNFTPEANQLAWYRDTLLHRTFFGNQNYWNLRFYFRYLNITDMNYLNRLQQVARILHQMSRSNYGPRPGILMGVM